MHAHRWLKVKFRVELEHGVGDTILVRRVLGRVVDRGCLVLELLLQHLIREERVLLESLPQQNS